ncbi:MAG TPA: glucoamylase family protein [Bryobacteraceae bacterium]|nr:glucoamylase family protein [Bryobacteraceae bacterium]
MDDEQKGPMLVSRRALLRSALGTTFIPLAEAAEFPATQPPPISPEFSMPALSSEEDSLLEDLEKASFQFFWEQADPKTGLVKDRCNVRTDDHSTVASIAATGFGLTGICIGQQRGYIPFVDARDRVLTALRFLWTQMPNHRGFYYHFANASTGERIWDSEVSSIDTAILLCGILTCRQHFRHSELTRLAYDIFNRVEWTWLSEDTTLLPHGWSPESGFLPYRWDYYSELMMMYLLGLGSRSHPLPDKAWDAWKRMTFEYEGIRYIGSFAPLFIHQYSQAWFDFRGKRDRYTDYFKNSMTATEVHRRFCIELGKRFPDYSEDLWGITASDSQYGYVVWGGPPEIGPIDGSVVPSAAGGSLPFMPQGTLRVLKTIRSKYGGAWSKYGFVNAFNPLTKWYDTDVVGIDTGITMLMAENLRTSFVWNTFMKNPEARRGLERAGFSAY